MQPFDALTMRAVIQEARPLLLNRRVDKIQQISRDEVVIALRSKAGTGYLLVSAQSSFGRICLVLNPPVAKSQNPPAFCQLLRKYLGAAVLTDIRQLPGERIVDLKFACTDELGNRANRILSAEIMGRHSNLICWDEETEKILAASHNVTQEMSRQREIAPGLRYCRPPGQEKLGIFDVKEESFRERFFALKETLAAGQSTVTELPQTFEQWLIANFAGLGRHLAEEIVGAGRLPDRVEPDSVNEEAFAGLWQRVEQLQSRSEYKASMREDLSRFSVVSWFSEGESESSAEEADSWKSFPSVNDMVDAYFKALQLRAEIQQLKDRIKAELKSEHDKLRSRLDQANKLLQESGNHARYKNFGDLILSNIQSIKPGQTSLVCDDLFAAEGGSVSIELNPNLSISQNAQSYYRLYAKARTRTRTADLSKNDSEKCLQDVMQHQEALDKAANLGDLQILKEQILDRGKKIETPIRQSGPKDKPHQKRLLSMRSCDGLNIIVGRNKNENDLIISKLAQPHDIWMHAQGLEGAHVLVKVFGKKDPPMTTLKEAAQLAARFSRSGLGGKVRVAYTYARYVRKIAKDKPGLVRYENEKTIEVDTSAPMPASLRKLFS